MWDYDRFEGKGEIHTNSYTFSGTFAEQEPIGDGKYFFNNLCAQRGEYVMTRVLEAKGDFNEMGEVFVPKWICTALASSLPRDRNVLL